MTSPLASGRNGRWLLAFGLWSLAESFGRFCRRDIALQPFRCPDHQISRWLEFLPVAAFIQAPAAHGHRGWHLAGGSGNGVAMLIDLHAQREAHGSKDFLDLIERFADE